MKKYLKNNFKDILLITSFMFSYTLIKQITNMLTSLHLGDNKVTFMYCICMFCYAIGSALFYVFNKNKKSFFNRFIFIEIILVLCILINLITSHTVITIFLLVISAICFGYMSGFAHYIVAKDLITKEKIGLLLAMGISIAMVFQVVLSMITSNIIVLYMFILSFVIIYILLVYKKEKVLSSIKCSKIIVNNDNKSAKVIMILIMILFATIIGIQDSIAIKFDVMQKAHYYGPLKLLYPVGAFVAGILIDYKKGKNLDVCALCFATISIISLFFINYNNLINFNLVMLFFFTGFYIVYTSYKFAVIAKNSNNTLLWSVLGKIIGSFILAASIIPANFLLEKAGEEWVIFLGLLCIVPLIIVFYYNANVKYSIDKNNTMEENKAINIKSFAHKFKLTEKEALICKLMLTDQLQTKAIALKLNISIRSIQRYLTSIYNKTKTNNKMELNNLYYNIKNK